MDSICNIVCVVYVDVIDDIVWMLLKTPREKGTCHRFHKATYTCITFPVFTFQRQYFLLRPCFGSTINKAQGQTLQPVGLDLRTQVFSHGVSRHALCCFIKSVTCAFFPVGYSYVMSYGCYMLIS